MSKLNCDLSFDPADPFFPLTAGGDICWAVQVFTASNGYGLDASRSVETHSDGMTVWQTTGYNRLGQQRRDGDGRVDVMLHRDSNAWTFRIHAEHVEPIKSVKLILRGIPAGELSQGWWSPTTPRDHVQQPPFQWNYPGNEWATRWAAAGRVTLSLDSATVSGTVLHVATPPYADGPEVELVHAVPAGQWSKRVTVPPIRLAIGNTDDDVLADFARHHARVRAGFGIPDWDTRADVPHWARRLQLVVTLHGQHWTGHVFHDYAEMQRLLDLVAAEVDPATVLVYLPGWEGRYYHAYPQYRPAAELGGDAAFGRLTEAAHRHGFHLMPMFGAHGAHVTQYPSWQEATLRNPSDRYPVMLNSPDWDGDRYPEGDQVFLNPAEPGFREFLVEAVADVVGRFAVDAAFFDTAAFWFDDPRHHVYDGLRTIATELRRRFPDLLLAAEGWWDAMTAIFPLSQQWLGVDRDIRLPQLLTDAARTTGHLAEGTPGVGSTGVHEQGFRPTQRRAPLPGHLPVVSFAGGDGTAQLDELRRLAAPFPDPTGNG